MRTRGPSRGEVWADHQGIEVLVLSNDAFNHSGMQDVVCLSVADGDLADDDESPYAMVVEVPIGDSLEQRTVFLDDLFLVPKAELADAVWAAPEELLEEAEATLEEILTPTPGTDAAPARPSRFPRTSEIRFADLHIPGEADKPVVVISSEEYGRLVGHAFVVACRVSSNSTTIRKYDVELRSQNGKVVCSHVQTVPLSDISFRTTPGAAWVSSAEANEIRTTVLELLGP